MKAYLLYIIGLAVLPLAIAACLFARLPFTAIAFGLMLMGLCTSIYNRISRLRYSYRETERENETLRHKLTESERQMQYLQQLTENVDTALFVCSTDGRIDWMNHAGRKILSPLTRQGEGLFLPSPILQAIADHAEVVNGCALSTVLLRIDGHRRMVVAMKDVSMLMQRQEMEAWQQLIRVLTHEIMNSLTPIISISETMMERESPERPTPYPSRQGGERLRDDILSQSRGLPSPTGGGGGGSVGSASAFAVINRRCHSLLEFVESYRQLTRIKQPERTTFSVNELFDHISALYPQVQTKGDGLLNADRSQLEQVLINLVKNAIESGATEVSLTAQPLPSPSGGGGTDTAIHVSDNGAGMTPDVLAHAFVPFYTTKPSGTGIGLSLCRQIILKHGGHISVDSQPGHGTTFTITL
ncbi:MAG: HAMP domain-containing histidine kinase [Bacteroidaceae bacterium]|nr:HAMP domain-containing histidine kinase [Bacteroidaceae bacterium]